MLLYFLFSMCLTVQIVHSKTDEEMLTWLFRQALECNKDYPITQEEMQMLQKQKMPNSKNARCLIGCVFKRAKYMDDKGMFDEESAIAQAKKNHEGDATKIENSKKLMEICRKVNSEPVEDGEAGCDRAQLLFKCFQRKRTSVGILDAPNEIKIV
ncbi:unnamed protein product [Arctia plantaginis]|uniref:Uncharacterized protein n=1 Tax=Arctia plantaginis TaxID=874455 RepID=A0A8S1AHG9_ARCPL|nr:unnamed protein product [Arctia plantaginis]